MLLSVLLAAVSQVEAPIAAQWLARIAASHGPDPCAVELVEEAWRSWRNDGLRRALWHVSTCDGNESYIVEFWPRDAFPGRADEVELIPQLPEQALQTTPSES